MITEIIQRWEKNKGKLEEYFKTNVQDKYNSYNSILSKIFELVINENEDSELKFDYERKTQIDDGDYQGCLIFIIPKKTYQPSPYEYVTTYVYYGSCSGCDTLQSIHGYAEENLPDEQQVKDYMTLALHMVQRLRWLMSYDEMREQERQEIS